MYGCFDMSGWTLLLTMHFIDPSKLSDTDSANDLLGFFGGFDVDLLR